jgi:hypothetical protein
MRRNKKGKVKIHVVYQDTILGAILPKGICRHVFFRGLSFEVIKIFIKFREIVSIFGN